MEIIQYVCSALNVGRIKTQIMKLVYKTGDAHDLKPTAKVILTEEDMSNIVEFPSHIHNFVSKRRKGFPQFPDYGREPVAIIKPEEGRMLMMGGITGHAGYELPTWNAHSVPQEAIDKMLEIYDTLQYNISSGIGPVITGEFPQSWGEGERRQQFDFIIFTKAFSYGGYPDPASRRTDYEDFIVLSKRYMDDPYGRIPPNIALELNADGEPVRVIADHY